MSSVRIDVSDNTHLIKSWKGEKIITDQGEKNIVVSSFGHELLDQDMELQERLEMLLFRCFNFTSKLSNYDELTGNHCPDGDLYCSVLRGTDAVSDHHCAGNICHHKSSEKYLKFLEIMFWDKYKVILDHNLKNRDIKILRSSGKEDIGNIGDYSIRWAEKYKDFIIKVNMENKTLEKCIVLSKILELNPDIHLEITLPIINDLPDWLEKIYLNWKMFIKTNIKTGSINEKVLQ